MERVEEETDSAPVMPVHIESIDAHLTDNRTAHHTDRYDYPWLIARRGQEFRLTLTAAEELPSTSLSHGYHVIWWEFKTLYTL